MKKLLILLIAIIFYGCGRENKEQVTLKYNGYDLIVMDSSDYDIIVIDSCEYLGYGEPGMNWSVLTHKGNCKFCIQRNKK